MVYNFNVQKAYNNGIHHFNHNVAVEAANINAAALAVAKVALNSSASFFYAESVEHKALAVVKEAGVVKKSTARGEAVYTTEYINKYAN